MSQKIPFEVGDLVKAPLWNAYTGGDLGVGKISQVFDSPKVLASQYVGVNWEHGESWTSGNADWLERVSPLERLARTAE